jgi:hypothetical protein
VTLDVSTGITTSGSSSSGGSGVSTNPALGGDALKVNEAGGTNNTAIGYQALDANTTGDANTAVGDSALGANTTASENTAVGFGALALNTTGTPNTAVGYNSQAANTTGSANASLGSGTLRNNTTGGNNTAIGNLALNANTTASNNTAVGYQALTANTTGTNNVAVGVTALDSNTTGTDNIAIGPSAGQAATTANGNVFIGSNAGAFTTGGENTFVGSGVTGVDGGAGFFVTTGSKNTILGKFDGNQGGLDIRTASNYIVLSDGDGNPRLRFDNNGILYVPEVYNSTSGAAANVHVNASFQIVRSTSSIKYKRDVQDATHGLAEVMQLRPVTYKGKSEGDGETVFGGLIAEEVHDAGLTEFVQYNPEGEPDALAYGNMVSLCVKAIQELSAQVTALQAEVNALKGAE